VYFEVSSSVFINGDLVQLKSAIPDDDEPKESVTEIQEGAQIVVDVVQGHRIEMVTIHVISHKFDSSVESDPNVEASEEIRAIEVK
jgi:uncharacterized protein YqiB (DUF1249 family)